MGVVFAVHTADVSSNSECEWGVYDVEQPVGTSLASWPASVNSDDEVEEEEVEEDEEVEDIVIEGMMRFRIPAEGAGGGEDSMNAVRRMGGWG